MLLLKIIYYTIYKVAPRGVIIGVEDLDKILDLLYKCAA